MSSGSDEEEGGAFMNFGHMEQQLLLQILAAKKGEPSAMPSAFLEDELFEDPFTVEQIKADPKKHILWAAENNHIGDVKNLLKSDSSLISVADEDLYTPLHRASYNGHLDMIKLLVENGADIHSKTADGWQPFHSACRWGNVEAAKILISQGADVHSLTNGNNTALHLAACNGKAEDMILFLLKNTAIDASVVNTGNDTAEEVAGRNSSYGKHFKRFRCSIKEEAEEVEEKAANLSTATTADAEPPRRRVVIVPGNGGGDVYRANWYGWAHKTLSKDSDIECRLENMPDPVIAHENVWIPFMEKELQCDENTVIIGHSSGAVAAMRYAETHKVFALVLVSVYISDLGDETERESGYFNRPWLWDSIKSNCRHLVQFGSSDDPFLPWEEQKLVAAETLAEFHSSDSAGHYMNSVFPDLIKVIKKLIRVSETSHS